CDHHDTPVDCRSQMRESMSMNSEVIGTPNVENARKKKQWSDLSQRQQSAIVVGAIVELVMTTIALADLARRPATGVRGPKPFWLAAFVVQPFGPILYFIFGRQSTTR